MLRSTICLAALLAGAAAFSLPSARANTFYVAAGADQSGNGSHDHPWPSVQYALQRCGGGHTVVLEPGIYIGGFHVPKACSGTAERPTIIRSETKWKAKIVGSAEHGIVTDDDTSWIVIDGFEVTGALYDGVKLSGPYTTVRNCWIHNNSQMGCGSHGHGHNVFEDNLIEFNGQDIQKHHGIYADGDHLTIRNNIVRHNASYGLHLYPNLAHSEVYNNLVYGHFYKAGILVQSAAGGGENMVVNNTSVDNRVGLDIRGGKGDVVENNILLAVGTEPVVQDANAVNTVSDYNLCVPASPFQGPHGLSVDPSFVDKGRQCYWLGSGSPAIGAGDRQVGPPTDFWGKQLSKDRPRDLGCFLYSPALTAPGARSGWPDTMPYRFAPVDAKEAPDLWSAEILGIG